MRTLTLIALIVVGLSLGACRNKSGTGALIGGAAGAAGGYMIGNEMDKDDSPHHNRVPPRAERWNDPVR